MRQLTVWQRVGLVGLLNAAVMSGPAYAAHAQDAPGADTPAAFNPAAGPSVALVAAPPMPEPQTTVRPVLDNPAEPGAAFPTDPWASND